MIKNIFRFSLPLAALTFGAALSLSAASFPSPAVDAPLAGAKTKATAVLAGGCFWGLEGVFEQLKGVTNVVSGFSGGDASTAHYETVSTGTTGHAESVKITYDPAKITYGQILKVYFSVAHDPTELNRQGPDSGTQYRSSIFYADDQQKHIAEAYIHQLDAAKVFPSRIVTQVVPLKGFYAAEDYHQHYLEQHSDQPYIVFNDLPKLRALKQEYPEMCKR